MIERRLNGQIYGLARRRLETAFLVINHKLRNCLQILSPISDKPDKIFRQPLGAKTPK